MGAIRLVPRAVEKPWGRCDIPAGLVGSESGARVGEIWFEDPRGGSPAALLIKYLFTSEKLSVQVHPDDEMARAEGLSSGKDEAWLILAAEPSAEIGIGMRVTVDREELHDAAENGAIERLLEWRPARRGDFYYLGAGTVHALGAGVKLIEVQQNADVTYRLFDYGRPRELHVEKAVAAARIGPSDPARSIDPASAGRTILTQGGKFVVEFWSGPCQAPPFAVDVGPQWVIPLEGDMILAGTRMQAGEAWLVEGDIRIALDRGNSLLLAYVGAVPRDEASPI